MTYKGIDFTPVIAAILGIIGGLFAWAQTRISAANKAAQDKANAEGAFIRLGAIAFAMVGDTWADLSREFQLRISDGSIDAADRTAFGGLIDSKIDKYTSRGELEKLAVAAHLPLPGVIAWVAEWAIDRLTKAHDTTNQEASAKAFPVTSEEAEVDKLRNAGG